MCVNPLCQSSVNLVYIKVYPQLCSHSVLQLRLLLSLVHSQSCAQVLATRVTTSVLTTTARVTTSNYDEVYTHHKVLGHA